MIKRLAGLIVLTAGAALAFTNPNGGCGITTGAVLPQAVRGAAITYTIATSGCGTPLHSVATVTGALPPGLTLKVVGSGATLTGTPTTSGVYAFALRVFDLNYGIPSKSFVIRVNDPLQIDTPAAATGTSGASYTDTIRVRGGVAPYAFSIVQGSLPAGLTLTAATGVISGTMPAAGTQFRVRVTDSSAVPNTAERPFTIVPSGQVTTLTTPPAGSVGTAYSIDIDGSLGASGFSLVLGALPTGMAMNTAGVIGGTPTVAGEYHFAVRQTAGTMSVWRSYRILVNGAGGITGTPRDAEENFAYDHAFTASGGVEPYTFSVSAGSLPFGITLDAGTGALLGEVPGSTGGPTTPFTINALDASGRTYSQAFSITQQSALQGFVTTPPTALVNQNVVGAAAYSLLQGGSGKVFNRIGGPGSGFIFVDPSAGTLSYQISTPGVFTPVVLGSDSLGGAVIFSTVPINVVGALAIQRTTELPNARTTVAYSNSVAAVNGNFTPLSFAVTAGTLPTGLSLNASTGLITGVPAAGAAGLTFPFTVTVSDAAGQTANRSFFIGVGGPLGITTSSVAAGTTGSVYNVPLSQTGAPSPLWSNPGGGLPPGITFSATGVLAGTPATPGSYTFLAQVGTAVSSATDTKQFTIHVADPLTASISPVGTSNLVEGSSVLAGVTTGGGRAPMTLSISGGSLPEGMYLQNIFPLSITGGAVIAGTSNFSVIVTDADGRTAAIPYTINVRTQPQVTTTTTLAAAARNVAYNQVFTGEGGLAPYNWLLYGTLPPGMTASAAGVVSGTPTTNGLYFFSMILIDAVGFSNEGSFAIEVTDPLAITNAAPMPSGLVLAAYNTQVTTTGGAASKTFSISTGDLPPLVAINPATGLISNLPLVAGTYNFTVRAEDSAGRLGTLAGQITIGAGLTILPATVPNGVLNTPYSVAFSAPGAVGAVTWSVAPSALPPGLTLNASTGLLSGTPTLLGSYAFTVDAVDSTMVPVSANFSMQVLNSLVITPATVPNGNVGAVYNQALTATGATGAVAWIVSAGALPGGLTLGAVSGLISGTPTTAGTFAFTVRATDSLTQTGTQAYSMSVLGGMVIAPASVPNGTVGVVYSQGLAATGATGAVAWIVSAGALPGGLTLGAANGLIGGTPTTAGTFAFTVQATDSLTQTGTQAYSMTVLAVLSIAPATVPSGTVGAVYSQPLTATGATGAVAWIVAAGALPGGLTLGASSGVIGGTPTTAGTFAFTVQATDSLGQSGTRAYSLTILSVLNVTPATVANGTVGVAYNQALTVTNGTGAIAWLVTAGALPAGLSLGAGTGIISGTPITAGTVSFTVQATDSLGQTGTRPYSPTIAGVLGISPATVTNGTVGSTYSQTLTATGATGAVTWAISSGALPGGLALGAATGAISGAPLTAGTFAFTASATDSLGQTGAQAYSMTVSGGLTIAPATVPNGTLGVAYNQTLTATVATGAVTWAVTSGALPAGLTLGAATGTINGTPTAAGTFTFTVVATDSLGPSGARAYTMTVAGVLTIAPATLSNGMTGVAYSQTLTVSGATGVVSWTISTGALPLGLALGATTGLLSGTPGAAGTSAFTVTATDSLAQSGAQAYSLTVSGVLNILPATVPNGTLGAAYSQALTVAGAAGAVTWGVTSGALPTGLALGAATGLINGTPTSAGTFAFTVVATDAQGQTGARAYSMTVAGGLTIVPATLPNGIVGMAYSQTLTATGAVGAVTWSISGGALPSGFTLGATTGLLSGSPSSTLGSSFTVLATDSMGQTGSRLYSIAVFNAISILPAAVPDGTVGSPYGVPFVASGSTSTSFTFSVAAGAIPPGLTLNTSGPMIGTLTTAGTYSFTIQAVDSFGQTGQRAYTMTVFAVLTITPPTLPDGTTGTAYSQVLTASGTTQPVSWSVPAGALPAGLTLGTSTGLLAGTPAAAGVFSFTVQATDSGGRSGQRAYTMTVLDPLVITTTSLPDVAEQETYSVTLTTNSAVLNVFTWSITSGSLPPGLALAAGSGVISGTATTHGTYPFTMRVTIAPGQQAIRALSILVVEALTITAQTLGDAVQGRAYASMLTAAGGRSPYVWALAGTALPAGLALNASTGQINGTTNVPEGPFPQNVTVTDTRGRVARKTLALNVTAPPPPSLSIGPGTLPNGRVGQSYSASFSATGGAPGYAFTVSLGAVPTGLSMTSGTLAGTPSQEGTYRFTVNATDSAGRVAGNSYTVVIEPALLPLVVTPSSIAPTAPVGQALTLQFGATGGQSPYTFAFTGTVPPGMSFNSSGLLSGTPSQGGAFTFSVDATDSLQAKSSRSYTVTVTGNLSIATQPPLAEGTVGKLYSVTFGVAGGRAAYVWSLSGTAAPGLTFDTAAGTLAGTPTAAGSYPFTVTVQDSQRLTATAPFSITIYDPLEITNGPADAALVPGQPFNFAFATRGGKAPVTFAVTGGALPAGLSMNAAGAISGTPTTAGTFDITVQATDALGISATRSETLRVVAALTVTTATLPSGTLGVAYSAVVAATGGVMPLGAWTVSQGAAPAGLTLAANGTISGTPTAAGTATFTVRIVDAAGTATTRVLSISIGLPPLPPLVIGGLPQTLPPGTQVTVTIQIAQPFPVTVTGTLTLVFEPNAVNNADDPAVQFSSGGRTVTFTIPAGETTATFPATPLRLLSGTVAGTIRIRTSTSPESTTPVPDSTVPIARTVPVITAGTAQLGTGTFTLLIDGFSNTREISAATFRLTPAAGAPLATTDVPVAVGPAFTTWYQSTAAAPFGGQFRLSMPFNVTGSLADIESVTVTVTNAVGASQPFTVRLR